MLRLARLSLSKTCLLKDLRLTVPHLSHNGAFLPPVAEHEAAEYIMQIIRLETNTSGPCPPEEEANECGEIGIFIPPSPCAEEFEQLPFPPRRRHAFVTLTSLSLLSLRSVLAPFFFPAISLSLQLGDKQRKQAAGDVDKAAPQINTPASELQNLPEIEGNLFAGDFG